MRKIIWSAEAKSDYESNIDYLLKEWSVKDAREFVDQAETVLSNLQKMPEMFPLSDYRNVRKGLICKQISIFYRVKESAIELVRFWNNYQDTAKLMR